MSSLLEKAPQKVLASPQDERDGVATDLGSKTQTSILKQAGLKKMSRYTVFIEPTATGYSAHVPDLPGCIAAARSLEETRQLIKEAIEFHIEALRDNGDEVPKPTRHIEQIEVSV
jgi:predicted RNase H-like HicB family nuclease